MSFQQFNQLSIFPLPRNVKKEGIKEIIKVWKGNGYCFMEVECGKGLRWRIRVDQKSGITEYLIKGMRGDFWFTVSEDEVPFLEG